MTELQWTWIIFLILLAAFSIALISAAGICLGFRMGRLTKGEQATIFPYVTKKGAPAYEDEPGGLYADHMAGGKYDQIEQAEEAGRMKTI